MMCLPDFCAIVGELFRFGPQVAANAALLIVSEVKKRSRIAYSMGQRFPGRAVYERLKPDYGHAHVAEQMGDLEQHLRRFVNHTAADQLQIMNLQRRRDW